MNTAIRYVTRQGSVDQLLLFYRPQTLKYCADGHNIIVATLTLNMKFTLMHVIL